MRDRVGWMGTILLLSILAAGVTPLRAQQQERVSFRHLIIADGLSQNAVPQG